MHYRVAALNTATESMNRIHDDEVARGLGFRGGLVPGVDVYAYLCHLPVERWGEAWLERGTMRVRFASPVYDGEQVHIEGSQADETVLELTLTDPTGTQCATARATLPSSASPSPTIDDWPAHDPPPTPPPASRETLIGPTFGRLTASFRADRAMPYLDDVREDLPLFRVHRVAHPGWLLRYANYVLTANVALGPWIHVESEVQFHGTVTDGDVVETRAVVTDEYERNGHHFVDLDVLQLVDDRVIARTGHTAIYRPRGTG